jgi:hypothetical protein
MNGLAYSRLDEIVNNVPHYRGNKNRFPIGDRRANNKYFLVREEDGQRVFDVVYGHRYHGTDITKEEHDALEAQGCKELHKYQKYDNSGQQIPDEFEYKRYTRSDNIVGTVRPDNTFEFNQKYYHQGERHYISAFSRGWLVTDSRRGGLVYSHGDVFHPIYQGMKINVETLQPSVPYEVFIHHVDRKAAKALLAKYEHFYKVSEVMLKNMTMTMVMDTAREVVDEIWKEDGGTKNYRSDEAYFTEAEKLIDDAPLDAFILYCIALNVGRLAYQMRYHGNKGSDITSAHDELFMTLKRRLSKEIYKAHTDIFKEVKCESGKRYPSCDWGVKIIVNGEEVEQIT